MIGIRFVSAETYHFLNEDGGTLFSWPPNGAYDSEGIVHLGVTKPKLPENVAAQFQVLQQHDSLFRWENWSLCLPFPQKPLDAKTNTLAAKQSTPLRLRPEFGVVRGTLPRLRFGKRYFLRCRVVDPAGNSLDKDEVERTDLSAALPNGACPFFFARHEPVNPPIVLVTSDIDPENSPGEQLDRLVIRDGRSSSQRCAAPARVSAMTAIIDGRYDDGTPRTEGAFAGAQLEKRSGEFPQIDNDVPAFRNPVFRYQPANSEPPTQPYLPDPYAVGGCVALATVNDEPIFDNPVQNELDCEFYDHPKAWPHAQPFLIKLVPADEQQREIARLYRKSPLRPFVTIAEVAVPRGEIVRVKLSSMLGKVKHEGDHDVVDTRNLERMALWRLTHPEQGCSPTVTVDANLQKRIVCGDFPLYTPHRDLTLVHAVRKPLEPSLQTWTTAARSLADTWVKLNIAMNLHRTSTGRVECEAEWAEPHDDLTQPACITKTGLARPGELKVSLEGDRVDGPAAPQRNLFSLAATHNFGDTKHRVVKYSLRATTRFREYYPEAEKPKNEHDETERAKLQVQEHQTYTTVFAAREENILSTARPPAPNLAYVVPTFRWEQTVPEKGAPESRRWGGGLRVYLERPWFATGEGELLGVVVYPGVLTGPLCKVMTPHITQWGRDPIWGLKPHTGSFPERKLPDFPRKDAFRSVGGRPIPYEEGLTIAALKNVQPAAVGCASGEEFKVAVVGFQPEFDQERNLWRCDIEMNPTETYFPFVRLGLARYQPSSLSGEKDCKLSAVVLAEFMQLTPDRWANLQYGSDSHRVDLTVTGFSYQSRLAEKGKQPTDGTGAMNVAVEERCKNRDGDLRWQRIPVAGSAANGQLAPVSVLSTEKGETVWKFEISLPRSRKVSRYRVVILESEIIAQDKDYGPIEYRDGSRIVYADVLGV